MFIVAGLGNPGIEYRRTRHNAGYSALDLLAERMSVRLTKCGFSGEYGEGVRNGQKVLLIKPTTYMNRSGDCLQRIAHFYKVPPEQIIVLCDDIDLPPGAIRIRQNGSAGTHNGLRSIVACLNSEAFMRVRIGVGDRAHGELADFVLGKPVATEQEVLDEAFCNAADAALMMLDGRLSDAQTKYNKRHVGKKPAEAQAAAPDAETTP